MAVKEKKQENHDFAHKVSNYRRLQGLSQAEMAKQLGVSRNYVSMIEGGRAPSEAVQMLFATMAASPLYLEKLNSDRANPIRAARELAGLDIREVSKKSGYKIGTLQALEEGRAKLSEKMCEALMLAGLVFDRDALMRNDEHPPTIGVERAAVGSRPNVVPPPGKPARIVPVISWTQAGELTGFEDQYEFEGQLIFDSKDAKAFAITIRGDSQEPKFSPGDVAVVHPSEVVGNGDLVVGKTTAGEVFFKKVAFLDGDHCEFKSYNPEYPPFSRHRSELVWMYPVRSVVKYKL